MKHAMIHSCVIGPVISEEQFIPEHFFLYLIAGSMAVYDGNKELKIKAGDYGLARRNYLAKYNKTPINDRFEKIVIVFDQPFLKACQDEYQFYIDKESSPDAIIKIDKNPLIESFIKSLDPYFNKEGKIEKDFHNIKRKELLLILLKQKPALKNIFFDFGKPEKLDLQEYMNRNYRFNVPLERFAFLTGRSLSAFKRDFQQTFNDTPGNWLMQKRLREAHFQINKKGKKPSDIYLELGFEDLSHFSFAFKKLFGHSPTSLTDTKKKHN